MTRIFHWFFMWKMDPMSGFDIRHVFTLPPRDSTLQYKRCVYFGNNFPCITSLILPIYQKQTETILKVKGTVDKVSNPPLKELNIKFKNDNLLPFVWAQMMEVAIHVVEMFICEKGRKSFQIIKQWYLLTESFKIKV